MVERSGIELKVVDWVHCVFVCGRARTRIPNSRLYFHVAAIVANSRTPRQRRSNIVEYENITKTLQNRDL